MPKDEVKSVKLMRSPIDTCCGNSECKKSLAFGTWVYYNPQLGEAICPECAVKRGWTPKQRVKQLIKILELREDIKTLRAQRKIEMEYLMTTRQRVKLHQLGERDIQLEQEILKLMDVNRDYLRHCGTQKEADALNEVVRTIRQTQELQREVRKEVEEHLFLLERREKKRKQKRQLLKISEVEAALKEEKP